MPPEARAAAAVVVEGGIIAIDACTTIGSIIALRVARVEVEAKVLMEMAMVIPM